MIVTSRNTLLSACVTLAASVLLLGGMSGAAEMTFQEGLNGYTGSYANILGRDYANPMLPGMSANAPKAYVHWASNVLLKFTNLTGSSNPFANIPAGATITGATLRVYKNYNAGGPDDNQISVYRMLKDWSTIDSIQSGAGGYVDGTNFIYEKGKNDRWTDPQNTQPMNAESPFPAYLGRKITVQSTSSNQHKLVIWGRKRDQNGVESFISDQALTLNGTTLLTTSTRFGWVDGAMLNTTTPPAPAQGDIIFKEQGTGVEIFRIAAGTTSTSVADNPALGRAASYEDRSIGFLAQQGWYEFDVTDSVKSQVAGGNFYGWLLRHDEYPLNAGGGPYIDLPASTVPSTRPQLIVEFTGVLALTIENLQVSVSGTNVTVTWNTVDDATNQPLVSSSKVIYGTGPGSYISEATGADGSSHSVTFDASSAMNPVDGVIYLQAQSSRNGYAPAATPETIVRAVHIGGIKLQYGSPLKVTWRADTVGCSGFVDYGPTGSYGSTVAALAPDVAGLRYSTYGGGKQVWIPAGAFATRSADGGSPNYAADPYAHQTLSNAAYKFLSLDEQDALTRDSQNVYVTYDTGGNQKDWWAQYEIPVNLLPAGFNFSGATWYFHGRVSQEFSGPDSDWLVANGDPGDLDVPAPSNAQWLAAATNTSEITCPSADTTDRVFNAIAGPPSGEKPGDAYRWIWMSNRHCGESVIRAKRFRVDNNKAVFRRYEREASPRNASVDYICWSDSASYVPTDEDCQNAFPVVGISPAESLVFTATIPDVDPGEVVHYRVRTSKPGILGAVTADQVFVAATGATPNTRIAAWQQGLNGYSGGQDNGLSTPGTGGENSPSGGSAYISCTPAGQSVVGFGSLNLPEDAVVEDARLRLVGNYSSYQLPARPWVTLYQMINTGWDSSFATWFKKNSSAPWGLPGALGAGVDIDAPWLDEIAEFDNWSSAEPPALHAYDVTAAVRTARANAGGGSSQFGVAFRLHQKPDDDPNYSNGWDWYWSHDAPEGSFAGYLAGKHKRPVLAITYKSALPPQSLGELERLPYGLPVSVSELVVTTDVFQNGVYYVETRDRSAGIAVYLTTPVSRWDTVSIEGAIAEPLPSSEQAIRPTSVTVTGSEMLNAPGVRTDTVSSSLVSGYGAETTGLLVKIWGKVTQTGFDPDTGVGYFYVDDGAGVIADNGEVGVKIYSQEVFPELGSFITATGIASIEKTAGGLIRMLIPRDYADIVIDQ